MLGIELSLDTSRIIGDIRTTTLNKALARKFIVLDYVREEPTTLIGMYILSVSYTHLTLPTIYSV